MKRLLAVAALSLASYAQASGRNFSGVPASKAFYSTDLMPEVSFSVRITGISVPYCTGEDGTLRVYGRWNPTDVRENSDMHAESVKDAAKRIDRAFKNSQEIYLGNCKCSGWKDSENMRCGEFRVGGKSLYFDLPLSVH